MNGFRISNRQSVKENIDRILFEQADYILGLCETGRQDAHQTVHEIRKSIKRIRAVLRLIRDEIGYSTYYRENVAYRDINRSLSDLRTCNVLILTLENIGKKKSAALPAGKMEKLTGSILKQREALLAEVYSNEQTFLDIAGRISEAKSRIPDLPVRNDSFEAFSGGILRMYRKGQDYLASAMIEHDTHHLHDMRKRMKYLWHQVQILKPIYPGVLGAFARSLESITEKLGRYHDLAILSDYLNESVKGLDRKTLEKLMSTCASEQSALLPSIFRKAGTAFGEEPEALVRRFGEYWRLYQEQGRIHRT